ncbi:MAG: Ribosome-binding ATPase YchF [Elusimicrobia bacterium]|nr:Ribosome-binding ATPase YchF [Elusimicrobiota bacterium]
MEIGIVGLPNVGKSSLFNALTSAGVASENFPFTTIEPNVGVVPVKDPRLDHLQKIYSAPKKIQAAIRFVDIAGLVPGASKGEGRGNDFLDDIRGCDAIAQVVRCFDDANVINVLGDLDPKKDAEVISSELLLADLGQVEKGMAKVHGQAKSGQEEAKKTYDFLDKIRKNLEDGVPVRRQNLAPESMKDLNLLTSKPVLYIANVNERTPASVVDIVKNFAAKEGGQVVEINNKLEADVMMLPEEERPAFREELGIKESGLDALAKAGQRLLNLITFFAAGPKEVHAWHISKGLPVTRAAGKIHSDLERGFIRAEVFSYDDLAACGSEAELRAKGKIRMEGKDYLTQDGDILHIHFKV